MNIERKEDLNLHELDPQDNIDLPICFWWDDMRSSEVAQTVKDAYERGFQRGSLYKDKYEELLLKHSRLQIMWR